MEKIHEKQYTKSVLNVECVSFLKKKKEILDLIEKYQLNSKRGEKQFQIIPKGDEEKIKMATESGKSI